MDQKEEVEEGEAVQWLIFSKSQGKLHMALVNHNPVNAGWEHTQKAGCVTLAYQGVLHWELLVRGAGAVRGAHSITSAAHTLLQAAEKSGSGKLSQTDGRMQRGLHRLAQEQFL